MGKPLIENFLAWWPLNEASGNRIDLIGALPLTVGGVSQIAALKDYGTDFDGIDDYMHRSNGTWCSPTSNEITFGVTISIDDNSGNEYILGQYYDDDGNPHTNSGWGIYLGNYGIKVQADTLDNMCLCLTSSATTYIMIGDISNGDNEINLYAYNTSGSLADSGTYASYTGDAFASTMSFSFGINDYGGATQGDRFDPFEGWIENFWTYDGIMTSDERLYMVNGGNARNWGDLLISGSPIMF